MISVHSDLHGRARLSIAQKHSENKVHGLCPGIRVSLALLSHDWASGDCSAIAHAPKARGPIALGHRVSPPGLAEVPRTITLRREVGCCTGAGAMSASANPNSLERKKYGE